METTYTTSLLFQKNDASPVFASIATPLQRGREFAPEGYTGIMLSGGFSQLSPGTSFPLSPTLQLNGDLTTMDEAGLESLAMAELERVNGVSYRSYTVEADKRVCVLAEDVHRMVHFVDTYEGVLDIEPLLLKGSHPDHASVTEIAIARQSEGYRIDYSIRSPINDAACTYCGNCGVACLENCLTEHLFLDYEKCTFCKECERVCPVGAIDIYSVETRVLEIPTILVLEGSRIDLPEEQETIFSEDELSELFKRLFPYQVDEVVSHSNSICQYSGRLGYGCRRCLESCSFGAVKQDENGVSVDPLQCRECGNCIAACPTGAIQYERFDDRSFVEYFRKVPLSEGCSVVLGNEEELHKLWWKHKGQRYVHQFFLEYPKVEALSVFHLLFLFALGAGRIVILSKTGGSGEVLRQVSMANRLLQSLFAFDDFIVISSSDILPQHLHVKHYHPQRRFYGDLTYRNRRAKIASVLQFLLRESGRGNSITVQRGDLKGFGSVDCDAGRCTHCLACLNECSMAALEADEKQLTLTYTAGKCVGCGVCVRVCPESALQLAGEFTIDNSYFQKKVLAQAEPATCKGCGKVFGTSKSLEKVKEIMSGHSLAGDGYLEYCDTCKVARIFETEES